LVHNAFRIFDGDTFWKPLPELRRTDADVVLKEITIGNIMYHSQVDDPLFSAHTVHNDTVTGLVSYMSDYRSGSLACAVQVSATLVANDFVTKLWISTKYAHLELGKMIYAHR